MKTTGVGFILSVGHKGHGHSYQCVAWYRFGPDVVALQRQIEAVREMFDHQNLMDDLELGEKLAEEIGRQLPGCIRVDVDRPLERIYARWEKD